MDPRRSAARNRLFIAFIALSFSLSATVPLHSKTVTLDHETLTISPAGAIGLYPDELLNLVVTHTNRECYNFNLESVEQEGAKQQGASKDRYPDTVLIPVIHHAGVIAYEVAVTKKPNLLPELELRCEHPGHTFRIPVETYEWGLALAGAFTGDKLTDPVYFLDEGVENPDAPPEMQRQGFFVRQSQDAQDSYRLGAAAMVHLFHTDPFRFDFRPARSRADATPGSGAGLVHWAPISFGLGVGEESDTRYYLGTSLRFGQKAYLTAGWVFGSRDRLPNGLELGGFTTESNALGSLGSQTDSAFFLSLSFDFLKVSPSSFLGAFETAKPKPQEGTSEEQESASEPADSAAQDTEANVLTALNATDETDRFRDSGIFKPDFEGQRVCKVEIAKESLATLVEVNPASLVDPELLSHPESDPALAEAKAAIERSVAELVAGSHEGKKAAEVDVTLSPCKEE